MTTEWLWLGAVFVLVGGLAFAVVVFINSRLERRQQRVKDNDPDSVLDSSQQGLVFGDVTRALSEQIPVRDKDREKLGTELRQAGFYSSTSLMEYAAVRALLILVPLFLAFALCLVLERAQIPLVLALGGVFAVLGYSVPRVYVNWRAANRRRQIERGLPIAVDLLALGLSGGQNVLAALGRVAREMRSSFPLLATELEIVRTQAEYSNLGAALTHWADRVHIPEVRNLVAILTQSEHLGTDIGTGLSEFATNYRTTLRQRADTQANRASFLMLFPTILGLWIPAAVILTGPIAYEFYSRGTNATARLKDARQRREANRAGANRQTTALADGTPSPVP